MRMLDTLAVTNEDDSVETILIKVYDVDRHYKDEHEAQTISDATEFMLDQSITQGRFSITIK
jgi:hypothetical protein